MTICQIKISSTYYSHTYILFLLNFFHIIRNKQTTKVPSQFAWYFWGNEHGKRHTSSVWLMVAEASNTLQTGPICALWLFRSFFFRSSVLLSTLHINLDSRIRWHGSGPRKKGLAFDKCLFCLSTSKILTLFFFGKRRHIRKICTLYIRRKFPKRMVEIKVC